MVLTWLTEQENCEQNIHTIKMPILFAEAEKEVTVSNKAIRSFYKLNAETNDKARFMELPGVCHSLVIFENDSLMKFVREVVDLF
jgi:alpha-beta hydrolase superfamily lysophospholipase